MTFFAPTCYPYMITRACSALEESAAFNSLPDGYIRIVLRIIKKINLSSPFTSIFATRATIAQESGKSLETVHRAIKWLEEAGFIEVREQKANRGMRGSRSPLTPTQLFLDALGLLQAPSSSAPVNPASPALTTPAPAQGKQVQGQKFVRIGNMSVPTDLAWLATENGVSPAGVLKLMGFAKKAKQRLSNVVSATRSYLENLTGRELYAYIKALMSTGKDFGHAATEAAASDDIERQEAYLRDKAANLEGRSFTSADGLRVVTVESGFLADVREGEQRVMRPMSQQFLDAIETGRLRERWACE